MRDDVTIVHAVKCDAMLDTSKVFWLVLRQVGGTDAANLFTDMEHVKAVDTCFDELA